MADAAVVWQEVMPDVKNRVTGVGLWTALNQSVAVAYEGDQFVIGVPHESGDLAGHLRMQSTKLIIERSLADVLMKNVHLRVIEGISSHDWELVKRKDEEAKRLQEAALQRVQAEVAARSSWEGIYEQISRQWASMPNKSLPQNRSKFYHEAIRLLKEALRTHSVEDDLNERNFARCIERVAQYTEIPSAMVAYDLLHRNPS